MIEESFLHFEGIGPARLKRLRQAGVRCWDDVTGNPSVLPECLRNSVLSRIEEDRSALDRRDIDYFVRRLATADRWRILADFLEHASFFDIETFGLEHDAPITTIAVWHRHQIHTFVEHENLDQFLDLLQQIDLLVSFNGASFDVPRVLDTFHIPELPCPHLDLRWLCYHRGYRGGLKQITKKAGIPRPQDLDTTDGQLAIRLWARWLHTDDKEARKHLIRYCAADAVLLVLLARQLSARFDFNVDGIWNQLPPVSTDQPYSTEHTDDATLLNSDQPSSASPFGSASPRHLRARRPRPRYRSSR